jgi:hypothetical protein
MSQKARQKKLTGFMSEIEFKGNVGLANLPVNRIKLAR